MPVRPNAGKPVSLANFQRNFNEGALDDEKANPMLGIGQGRS